VDIQGSEQQVGGETALPSMQFSRCQYFAILSSITIVFHVTQSYENTSPKNTDSGLHIWRPVIMLYLKNINQSIIELEMKFGNYKKKNNKMSHISANKIQRPGSILIANVKLKLALVN